MYTNVHSSSINNSPKVEATQIPISWWMKKQNEVFPCSGIYFSHKKWWSTDNTATWMKLENILLSERSRAQKAPYCVIPFIWNIQNRQIDRDGKHMVVVRSCRGWERSKWRAAASGYRTSFVSDVNILELDSGDSCTVFQTHTHTHTHTHKPIELYTLKGWISQYVNCISKIQSQLPVLNCDLV